MKSSVVSRRSPWLSGLAFGAIGTILAARFAYVVAGSVVEPLLSAPGLDGAYYLSWARSLAEGGDGFTGAYYLAPLYAYLLAAYRLLVGESLAPLYIAQQALSIATAWMLGRTTREIAGPAAGWCAAVLVLLYHPVLFFASRPLGETLAVFLVALGLRFGAARWNTARAPLLSGLAFGFASLARPNLIAVPLLRALGDLAGRRWRQALLVVASAASVLAPTTVRNWSESGHLVPVSSNVGLTLYHGNGPGASGGYTLPAGFSGSLASQREEATAIASARVGRRLDPVEADRWWGREALRVRGADPVGTVRLLAWKALLLLDSHEHGLDEAPALDGNPLRWVAPLPFALLLSLAAFGVVVLGWTRTGGGPVWSAITGCALTPLVFYASSRYRLPMGVLLAVPAGAGLASVPALVAGPSAARARLGAAAGFVCAVVSLAVPSGLLIAEELPTALANRGAVRREAGDLRGAEEDTRHALLLRPQFPVARFNLGVILQSAGRPDEAKGEYRRALEIDPSLVEAAANLSALLIWRGEPAAAVPILRDALSRRADHAACSRNLVVALLLAGDGKAARAAADRALAAGVTLPTGLREALERADPPSGEGSP